MTMRRILIAAAVAALGTGLAACGSTNVGQRRHQQRLHGQRGCR